MNLHDIKTMFDGWLKAERDIRVLQRFDNHLLADLGVERRHIAAWVKGRCR